MISDRAYPDCPVLSCLTLAPALLTEESIFEIPAGKDNTTMCTAPFASVRQADGAMMQLTASYEQEVLLLATHAGTPLSTNCVRAQTMVEDVIDQWAHSVPHVPVSKVLATKAPGKVSGFTSPRSILSYLTPSHLMHHFLFLVHVAVHVHLLL